MAFLDIRFPDDISYGAIGGPGFSTDIVVYGGGHEQRNDNWGEYSLCKYEVSHAARLKPQIDALIAHFRVARGRTNTFRYKDWMDYQCLVADGILGLTGIGTGEMAYQIYKKYSNAGGVFRRKLVLPLTGTLIAYRNGSPITVGAGAGNISINYLTGIITFLPDVVKSINANSAKSITGITQANPGNVTCVGHGFITGDKIKLSAVVGMTQVNNLYFTVTNVDADHFTIGVNTTAYGAYTSGGTATKHGITQTSPARVYSTAHGFTNAQLIRITSAAGMTEINGLVFTVANASTDYFDLSAIDASAYGTYTGSGVIGKGPQPADLLTVTCDFDVLCRYDVDDLRGEIISHTAYGWSSIPIVEVPA